MTYIVVVNHEDQHSVWPESRAVPAGWRAVGFSGARDECLAHIATVWTDICPASVRSVAS